MILNYVSLGRKVRFFRTKRGMTQEELAERVGCSPPYVSYIECGYKCMSLGVFVAIANALGVSSDELLVDSLENSRSMTDSSFSELIADCSEYELRILLALTDSAKSTLRNNRQWMNR